MRKKKISTLEIYQQMRQDITDFILVPGARVTESALATKFKVSRTPVREALQKLALEGFLEIRPKQGCFIRQVDIAQISDFYDVRVALEGMAVELACANIPLDSLHDLSELWNPAHRPSKTDYLERIRDLEENFHVTLAEHSGNRVLAQYLREVNDDIRIIRRLAFIDEQTIADTYKDHYAICQLLIKRDATAAREAMIQHIRKSQITASNVTLSQLQQQTKRKSATKKIRKRATGRDK